jgi:hypothetical protein
MLNCNRIIFIFNNQKILKKKQRKQIIIKTVLYIVRNIIIGFNKLFNETFRIKILL